MNVTGVGVHIVAGRAIARRYAQHIGRLAAPARHRQEVDDLCGPRHRSRACGRPARQARSHHGLLEFHQPGRRAHQRAADRAFADRLSQQHRQIGDLQPEVRSGWERPDIDATIRDGAARSYPRSAEYAGWRPLSVFRARRRQARDRHARPHPQRRRRARRIEADDCRAQSGRSRKQRARAVADSAGGGLAGGDLGGDAADGVRHEARVGHAAQWRDGDGPDRLARRRSP